MQKKTPSESAFFNLRMIAVGALFLTASLLAYVGVAAPSSPSSDVASTIASPAGGSIDWRAKVDPAVATAAAQGETEFMIYMAHKADLRDAAALETKEQKGLYVYNRLTSVAEATQAPVKSLLAQLGAGYKSFWISNALWARGNLAVVQAVAALPDVAAIHPVGKGALRLPPRDKDAPSAPSLISSVEPGLALVNADDVWAMGYRGQGVVVAGADTGVRFTHTALRNQYRGWGGSPETSTHDYNWKDAIHIPNWPPEPLNACNPGGAAGAGQPSPQPCDDDTVLGGGHGSHTMGSVAGFDGGTNQIGMAPQSKWIACRNMSNGVGAIPTYMECMEWFIAPTKIDGTAPDPTKAPHVINNSWGCLEGCPPEPNPLRDTLIASRAAGIVYVASAGNDGSECNTIFHPLARYPEAFTVGSTTHTTDLVSSFSSRGPTAVDPNNPGEPLYRKPDISAPGSSIRSSLRGSDTEYGSLSGTSMAGPHVAGLVALVISANPALAGNVNRIEQIIEQSAVPKTTTEACNGDTTTQVPNNTYGWGRIDALAAVNLALGDITAVPLVGIASRKTHGAAGTFGVNLPLANPIGIECRVGQPADGNHTIVFTFATTLSSVTGATVESGTGSVSSSTIGADPHEYIVNLTGVTNAQSIMLTVTGLTDTAGGSTAELSVPIGFLLGDTTANRAVNSSDVSDTKARSGETTNTSNFRVDVTANGAINSSDIGVVKSNSGSALP